MAFGAKLTKEEKKQVLLWAATGMGYTEIARKMNNKISKQRVQQLCRKAGIDVMALKKVETLRQQDEERKARLGSFFTQDPEKVDVITYKAAYKKFKNKQHHGHWSFDIEFADIEFPKRCPIFDIELDYFVSGKDNSAEFDRIDSTKGYVKGNVWIICRRANRVKNDGTAEEHRLISNAMFKHNVK